MITNTFLMSSVIALIGASAQAAVTVGDVVGTAETDIRTNLEQQGYTVQRIEIDGDEIEVDTLYDGTTTEIELSGISGAVLDIEIDQDDDDD